MSVKLLTEHHLEFLSLKGGCICSSESTFVKLPHCWESHVMAHFIAYIVKNWWTQITVAAAQLGLHGLS